MPKNTSYTAYQNEKRSFEKKEFRAHPAVRDFDAFPDFELWRLQGEKANRDEAIEESRRS